jgi:hypothetical protein
MPKVLTHKGFKSFDGIVKYSNKPKKVKIKFSNNQILKCSIDHKFMQNDFTFKEANQLKIGDILYKNISIVELEEYFSDEEVYDLINVKDTKSYQTNGIESHNCILDEFAHIHNNLAESFFNSVYPVISSGETTKITIISTPKGLNHFFKLFTDAKAKRNDYFCIDIHWTRVPGRDQEWKLEYIRNTSERQWLQEIESVGPETIIIVNGKKMKIVDLYDELVVDK